MAYHWYSKCKWNVNTCSCDSIVTSYIQCHIGRDLTPINKILTYHALARNPIDFGDVFLHNLQLTIESKSQSLPYEPLIMHLLECIGGHSSGEEIDDVKDY